jgi:hypothetical protein
VALKDLPSSATEPGPLAAAQPLMNGPTPTPSAAVATNCPKQLGGSEGSAGAPAGMAAPITMAAVKVARPILRRMWHQLPVRGASQPFRNSLTFRFTKQNDFRNRGALMPTPR